jgi:hypothetical protein
VALTSSERLAGATVPFPALEAREIAEELPTLHLTSSVGRHTWSADPVVDLRERHAEPPEACVHGPCGSFRTAAAVWVPQAAAEAPATGRPAPDEVITWGASADRMGEAVADPSYRLVVRTSVAGSGLRIRLSNAFGDRPVTFGRAYARLRESGAALVRGSNRRLTFGGEKSVTVPLGETVHSDPLPGKLPAQASLVVSIQVTDAAGPATGHGMAMQTSYAAPGDHAAEQPGSDRSSVLSVLPPAHRGLDRGALTSGVP